jgi:uncharacterized protein
MSDPYWDLWPNDDPPPELPELPAELAAAEALAPAPCWRCGKEVAPTEGHCLFCNASTSAVPSRAREFIVTHDREAKSLSNLIGVFIAMLIATLVTAGLARLSAKELGGELPPWTRLTYLFVGEGIDTVLVLTALVFWRVRQNKSRRSLLQLACCWTVSVPCLGAMLLLNFGYHQVLTHVLKLDPENIIQWNNDNSLLLAWSLAICFQPAVIEELYFRYLMFDALRMAMGTHAVVWITAVMFAACHIGVPLSMPVLFVLGLLLGYARWASGGVLLPMFLHFLHNTVVLGLQAGFF